MGVRSGAAALDSSEVPATLRHLAIFKALENPHDGKLSTASLSAALSRAGLRLPARLLQKVLAEVDSDGRTEAWAPPPEVGFREFCDLVRRLSQGRHKGKAGRLPRAYLSPEQFDQYTKLFARHADEQGLLSSTGLQVLLEQNGVGVPPERLRAALLEGEDSGGGVLDEGEFLIVVIKALGIKKRTVGRGQCPLFQLQAEGWSASELKRASYEVKDFLEAGYGLQDIVDMFSAAELRKASVAVPELLAAGWDCARARDAGFDLGELVRAGCSMRKIRSAGWEGPGAAAQLHKLGVDAGKLKQGGFGLSELRLAGYSQADLRLAGYSAASLAAMQQLLRRTRPPDRQGTRQLREDAEQTRRPAD